MYAVTLGGVCQCVGIKLATFSRNSNWLPTYER